MTLIGGVLLGPAKYEGARGGEGPVVKEKETPKKEKEEVRNEPAHARTPAKPPERS